MNDKTLVERLRNLADEWFEMCDDIHEPLNEAATRIEALEAALRPFASLMGEGVNMNDPLSKWVTIAQIADAHDALESKP